MDALMTVDTSTPGVLDRPETDRFEYLALTALIESGHNPRRHFDPAKLAELAESIREKGIVEPLVVRTFGAQPNQYEIIAGARRYRAARSAGLTHVPCIVREYSDEDVLELFLVENVQRDDLAPLEQARGFKQLLTANPDKYSAATIATKVGMSPAWVWDRLKLLDLVPEAQNLLDTGRISVGHAIVLARLKPADQERAIDPDGNGLWEPAGATLDLDEASYDDDPYQDVKPRSIRELEAWVANHVRFDVAHAAQAQPLVFTDLATQVEAAAEQPGRGKKVISITYNHHTHPSARDDAERTYSPQSWRRADGREGSATCDHAVLGVVVVGPHQGRAFQVCIARDTCRVHFADEISAKEKAAKARAKGDTKQAARVEKKQEDDWKRRQREHQERQKAWAEMWPHLLKEAVAQVSKFTALTPSQAKHLVNRWEVSFDGRFLVEHLGKQWHEKPVAALLACCINGFYADEWDAFVRNVAKPIGLNLKALQAVRDAHTPKPAAAGDLS